MDIGEEDKMDIDEEDKMAIDEVEDDGSEYSFTGDYDVLQTPEQCLSIIFMDVGQGNGTLIKCPKGEVILVDCGCKSSSGTKDMLTRLVKEFIKQELGMRNTIDYLVISHPDGDHLNLVDTTLTGVDIGQVILGGFKNQYSNKGGFLKFIERKANNNVVYLSSEYSESPMSAKGQRAIPLKDKKVDVLIVSANAPIASKTDLECLFPDSEDRKILGTGTKPNTCSIVLAIRYKGTQIIILAADATFSTESFILRKTGWGEGALRSYALSGGHHGSHASYSPEFLKAVNPSWVHFSADNRSQFMHARWSAIQRVVENCPGVLTSEYGPHGIVAGLSKTESTFVGESGVDIKKSPLWSEFCMSVLAEMKKVPDSSDYKPGEVGAKAIDIVAAAAIKAETDMRNMKWLKNVLYDMYKLERYESIWKWGEVFEGLQKEFHHISQLQFTPQDPHWEWFVTTANIFTSLETADLGVYWQLDIYGNGEKVTSLR